MEEESEDSEEKRNSANSGKQGGLRPEFRIISRNNREISEDALTIHGFEQYKANHYRLGFMSEGEFS